MLDVSGLTKVFGGDDGFAATLRGLVGWKAPAGVRAVSDVDLSVRRHEIVGIVGESGCGKSTLARMIAGGIPASSGTIRLEGKSLSAMTPAERNKAMLGVQMVFQDPSSSLNPRIRIGETLARAPRYHRMFAGAELDNHVDELLTRVGLDPAIKRRLPHQFSGGQRQRIGIARALAVRPSLLVCDEAVAALDVSIQAQILDLFLELQAELGLTYLFISHDLGVISYLCDRVVVMYLGRVVEIGTRDEVFHHPRHPYTVALMSEAPRIRTGRRVYASVKGEIPSPLNPPSGCPFHPRCPNVMPVCRTERPKLGATDGGAHAAACHLVED